MIASLLAPALVPALAMGVLAPAGATDAAPSPASPGDTEAAPDAAQAPAEAAPTDSAEPVPVDERGYPVVRYSEVDQDPGKELEWAEETPPPPELEYAQEGATEPELETAEGLNRPAPHPEALERQGPTTLTETSGRRSDSYESPQRFALEVKFGPYLPNVDGYYTGSGLGPYATVYGRTGDDGVATKQPRAGLFSGVGFDWQFVHLAGPLSIGASVGFFRDRADAIVANPADDAETIRSPADKTGFTVIPITLVAGYRFELLADRAKVPLVPYIKGGLAYGIWRSTDGNGDVSENDAGEKGSGGSLGWQVQGGLMLRLDFLERGSSRTLDRVTGINHTYLFGEYQLSRLTGFGVGNRVDVGDDTWLLGLAMEF